MNLQQRKVVNMVDADHGGLEFLLVPQGYFDGLGVIDDVVVGEDVALIVYDEA